MKPVSIKVRLKNGTVTEYVKPKWCPIPDEEWKNGIGYCWGFALRQDEGEVGCTGASDTCYA